VLDRQLLKDYLRKEWTILGDFHSNQASLQLGRDLGATGVVRGGLVEENGQVVLKIHTEGFRPWKKDPDSFNDTTKYVRLTATQEPFGLTTKAIAAVQSWKFKPAQKDGMPVPVRAPVELCFGLF
jgi:hypothetical protein